MQKARNRAEGKGQQECEEENENERADRPEESGGGQNCQRRRRDSRDITGSDLT